METEKDYDMINKVADELKDNEHVSAVILFGSYARDEQKPISDIDICILTSDDAPESFLKSLAGYSSEKVQISVFGMLPSWVRYNILKEGRVIFKKSDKDMHDATVRTMSEYLDFGPILRRNIKRVFGS